TFAPASVGDRQGIFSAGLAVIDDRAYLAETLNTGGVASPYQRGNLRGFDISDPVGMPEVILPPEPFSFPPQDMTAGLDADQRKTVAIATFPQTRYQVQGEDIFYTELISGPASVLIYDVTSDRPLW